MSGEERLAELRNAGLVFAIDDELVWIGATVWTDRHGFAAVNDFRTAFAEARPTTEHFVADAAGGGAIPTFHGLNGVAVADALAVDCDVVDWLSER